MITLKEYLKQKFNSSIFIISFISWIIVFFSLLVWGFFSTSKNLSQELDESAITITSMIYDKNWGFINEHFNSRGRAGFFSYVVATSKQDNKVLYEARFSENMVAPEICRTNRESELVSIKACSKLINFEVLFFVTMAMLMYSLALFILFKVIQRKILLSLDLLSDEISKSLEDDLIENFKDTLNITEIENIKSLIKTKTIDLKRTTQEAAFIRLSQKVTHDLRSPIAVIVNISKKADFNPSDKEIMRHSALMLKEISNNLLNTSLKMKLHLPRLLRVNVLAEVLHVIKLKEQEYPTQVSSDNFILEICSDACLWLNPMEFRRVLSNLINNSLESNMKAVIKIEASSKPHCILRISDNGPGFTKEFLEEFSKGSTNTTKSEGFGIGISSAKTYIESMRGKLNIFNHVSGGACVEMTFSSESLASKEIPIVLIDDDKYIRQSWTTLAKQNNFILLSFNSFEEFESSLAEIDRTSEVFIDSCLGGDVKGEALVSKILLAGFKIVNLQTGFNDNDFEPVNGLNNIVSKEFPYTV